VCAKNVCMRESRTGSLFKFGFSSILELISRHSPTVTLFSFFIHLFCLLCGQVLYKSSCDIYIFILLIQNL